MRARARRTLQAALLLPLVLLAATPTDLTRFFCRMDGTVSAHRCCPAEREDSSSPTATLKALTCCTSERMAVAEAPVRPTREGNELVSLPPPVLGKGHVVGPAVTAVIVPTPRRGLRPPGLGPPLRLSKQSFLI
ncbi:MAG TPA: hypothetical protein VGG33_02760 [Polyangia bacterium]